MHAMERNEPSLVPEWLRSNGGGIGGGGSAHHFASSQADGPVLASPLSRSSKSISNYDSLHSPRLDRSSSSNSRRSSDSNGFSKHEKNSYARSYSSFSRSNRDRDRERSTNADSWNLEYSNPLKGLVSGRAEDSLRRSQSLISQRQTEAPQRRIPSDLSNSVRKNYDNGTHSLGVNVTGTPKVSFERDFPVLGSEERPKTPDVIRVSSPGLSRGIQSSSIGNPPSVSSEAWTSTLAVGPGRNTGVGSLPNMQSAATSSPSSGRNMAAALVQAPAQSHNSPQVSAQLQKDDLAIAQSKKLIPVTPLLHKTTVLSSSDKLKPKTAMRSSEIATTPKNGVHPLSPLQLGSQPVRGASVRGDDPKSPSAGKLLLLKPGREISVSSGLKDLQTPANNLNIRVANGQSSGSPSASTAMSKTSPNPKSLPDERKTSGHGLNPGVGVDRRTSRSNFFKLVREKSLNNTPGPVGSGASSSLEAVDKLDNEVKESSCTHVTPAETASELKCNGETCTVADDLSPSMEIDNEKERAFLLSLGWEDNDEDDEEGLTKEEIEAFYKEVMRQGATSRLCRLLQAKLVSHVSCSSNEPNASVSQTGA
ncbi:hypothetical protein RND81_03G233800 [Saponaria officinalis]|uniref:Uncharacterized protein n=1 Tax=Saponaria officinalis TaxID=3572 RepID=A0AAW1M2D9_SAPOF